MNRMQQLEEVFTQLKEDDRLSSVHVALFDTLVRCWRDARYVNPFPVERTAIRRSSKIRSEAALDKYFQELELWGYLRYFSSVESSQDAVVHLKGQPSSTKGRPRRRTRKPPWRTAMHGAEELSAWPKLAQVIVQVLVQLLIAFMNRHFNLF